MSDWNGNSQTVAFIAGQVKNYLPLTPCFMASVYLRDAYYSIPIVIEDRKYLMFEWQGSCYQFTCLPNRLACAPQMFNKFLKPVYTHIRMLGLTCVGHIDDS